MSKHFVSPQNFASTKTGPVGHRSTPRSACGSTSGTYLQLGCRNCFGDVYFNQALPFPASGFITVYTQCALTWTLTARTRF